MFCSFLPLQKDNVCPQENHLLWDSDIREPRTRTPSFQIGQEVFRRNFAQSNAEKNFNAKLSPVFIKARVREKLGNHYYILEDFSGKLVGTFHAKDIRS